MDRARGGTRRIGAGPKDDVVPPRSNGGPPVACRNIGSDHLRGGPFKKQGVVRTRGRVERVGNFHVAALDRKLATKGLDTGVTEVGPLNARQAAAWEEADRRATCACRAGETIGSAGEVVIEEEIPVTQEFTQHADAGAASIDAVVEALWLGVCSVGAIVVTAGVKIQAAGQRDAILLVSGAH